MVRWCMGGCRVGNLTGGSVERHGKGVCDRPGGFLKALRWWKEVIEGRGVCRRFQTTNGRVECAYRGA